MSRRMLSAAALLFRQRLLRSSVLPSSASIAGGGCAGGDGVAATERTGGRHAASSMPTGFRRQTVRRYRATQRQEIVPLLAAGTVLLIGRWSWKAMNRMDQEWADYQWELEQWERTQARSGAQQIPTTVGVDIGSVYNKVASTHIGQPVPTLLETPQGERLRFVAASTLDNTDTNDPSLLSGATALDRFFYKPDVSAATEQLRLPYQIFANADTSVGQATTIVQSIVEPSVGQVLERVEAQSASSDRNKSLRTVVTLSPKLYNRYSQAIEDAVVPKDASSDSFSKETVVLPDPVAALWGAQSVGCIPTPTSKDGASNLSCIVVDIGGLETTVSLVEGNSTVTSFATLPDIGGEALVQKVIDRILKETTVTDADGNQTMTLTNDAMSLSLITKEARQAVLELVHKNNIDIHIPYLLMGQPDKSNNPHFSMNLSRTVLESMVEDHWREIVYPALMYGSDEQLLSPSLPAPTDISTLLSSVTTKLLEDAGRTPDTIDHVLVTGGGSRHPFLKKAVENGVGFLLPPDAPAAKEGEPKKQRFVCPEPSTVRSELTAVGAASLLPTQTYTYYDGLKRKE